MVRSHRLRRAMTRLLTFKRRGAAIASLTTLLVLALAGPAAASPPTPPFTQCPALGFDTSCAILIVVEPNESLVSYADPTQGPFDGIEDTLIGVQNESKTTVKSIALQ